jgi:hypothetical protein
MPFASRRVPGGPGWLVLLIAFVFSPPALAGPILFGPFYEFSFTEAGVGARGCDPADPMGEFCIPSSGTPTIFLDEPPWTFTAPTGGATLLVTDAFETGDQFEVLDFGTPLGFTSVPTPGFDCGDDPVPCSMDPTVSSAVFLLGAGDHSITIAPLIAQPLGGAGYLRVTQTQIPEPWELPLLAIGLLALGLVRQRSFRGAA